MVISICLLSQKPPKWVQLGPKPKNVLLLLGKAENDKSTETETWHSESVEESFYYRLYENF